MTAVQWLVEQMKKCNMTVSVHNTSHQNVIDFYKAIEQAKEMEKQQIINARDSYINQILKINDDLLIYGEARYKEMTSEQYYKETFKSE